MILFTKQRNRNKINIFSSLKPLSDEEKNSNCGFVKKVECMTLKFI